MTNLQAILEKISLLSKENIKGCNLTEITHIFDAMLQ